MRLSSRVFHEGSSQLHGSTLDGVSNELHQDRFVIANRSAGFIRHRCFVGFSVGVDATAMLTKVQPSQRQALEVCGDLTEL